MNEPRLPRGFTEAAQKRKNESVVHYLTSTRVMSTKWDGSSSKMIKVARYELVDVRDWTVIAYITFNITPNKRKDSAFKLYSHFNSHKDYCIRWFAECRKAELRLQTKKV